MDCVTWPILRPCSVAAEILDDGVLSERSQVETRTHRIVHQTPRSTFLVANGDGKWIILSAGSASPAMHDGSGDRSRPRRRVVPVAITGNEGRKPDFIRGFFRVRGRGCAGNFGSVFPPNLVIRQGAKKRQFGAGSGHSPSDFPRLVPNECCAGLRALYRSASAKYVEAKVACIGCVKVLAGSSPPKSFAMWPRELQR